jgi:hypothetical protein
MPEILKAIAWAVSIIAIAIASRMELLGEELGEWLMMAVLIAWVTTLSRRNGRPCPIIRN